MGVSGPMIVVDRCNRSHLSDEGTVERIHNRGAVLEVMSLPLLGETAIPNAFRYWDESERVC
jgi:hypothetical protein